MYISYILISLIQSWFAETVHSAEHRHDIVTEMDMWCNNLQHNLECAAKEKRLNDFLVSLSPNLSIKYVMFF